MAIQVGPSSKRSTVKRYQVRHPVSAYTFPRKARIAWVRFDLQYLHVGFEDGRKLSVPLQWIPTLAAAPAEEREKYEISPSRTMLIWDPEKCALNEELSIADYLSPG